MKITALVMAGGKGKRMDIFCQQRPKPALPFRGNCKVIDFTLSNCVNSQIWDIGVLVDYKRSIMTEYLNKWKVVNENKSLSILQPLDGSYNGTSDAVYQNLDYLRYLNSDKVLILAGDHIYKMDYRKMLDFHQSIKAGITLGIVRVPVSQAMRFGTVAINSEGRILEFVEKSSSPQSNIASMGIYIFDIAYLEKYLVQDSKITGSLHDFGYSILPRLVKQERVFAYEFTDYWQDIGTVESYYGANMDILRSDSYFKNNRDWPILTSSHHLPQIMNSDDGMILNSLISPGCVIKGSVENSVLSPGVFIGENTRVVNSVIMNNCSIGCFSVVDKCVLDEDVHVGKFCYLGFGSDTKPGVWDVSLFGKDVKISDETVIGKHSKIPPDLIINSSNSGLIVQV